MSYQASGARNSARSGQERAAASESENRLKIRRVRHCRGKRGLLPAAEETGNRGGEGQRAAIDSVQRFTIKNTLYGCLVSSTAIVLRDKNFDNVRTSIVGLSRLQIR